MIRPVRWLSVVAMAIAFLVAGATPASAHTVTGVQATNYKSEILAITPPRPDIHLRLLDFGRRVRLTYKGQGEAVVLDPQGAPLHRVASGHTLTWRDTRTRGEGNARVTRNWNFTIQAATGPVIVTGRIIWVPPPHATGWFGLAAGLFAVTAGLAFLPGWRYGLAAALAVLIASDAVHAFASAAPAADPIPLLLVKVLLIGLFTTLAWIIGAIAIGPLQRGREGGVLGAGLAGFIIAMFSGIGDAGSLTHSQLPYSFAPVAARLAVAISLGVGFGLVAAAALVLKRHPSLRPAPALPATT